MIYETKILFKLIDPLLKDVEDFNTWIFGTNMWSGEPKFDELAYSRGDNLDMLTQQSFDELVEKIYDPEVIEIKGPDDKIHLYYSQAVPSDTNGDRAKIKFYLFFMVEEDQQYSSASIDDIETSD